LLKERGYPNLYRLQPEERGVASGRYSVGVDIGGTFTDFVLSDESGNATAYKLLTTYPDPSQGVVEGLRRATTLRGASFTDIALIAHGTTWATNAIIERKGARTALLTTEGFRDLLQTGTEIRYDLYDIFLDLPQPLVERRFRVGVQERISSAGQEIVPLNTSQVAAEVRRLISEGIESLAICFLHSYANSSHEDRAARVAGEIGPTLHVSVSSRVLTEMGEYIRLSTTVANAYVEPKMKEYLEKLVATLGSEGLDGSFYVMASNGGLMRVREAAEYPVKAIESGPAAGAAVSSHYARLLNARRVMALDIGGTTAKMCLILDGEPLRANELEVARLSRFKKGSGLMLKTPSLDLIEIGTGGGSLAEVNSQGLLKVGPESSGANPGPACYGLGGTRPTVTDAALVLGYLNPEYFLGGEIRLDLEKARSAIKEHVAKPLKKTVVDAAKGILEVANESMVNAASVYSAERGMDIRSFVALAFGGAGPVHAWALARRLSIAKVVIPLGAGVFSALGCIVAPVSADFSATYRAELDSIDPDRASNLIEMMESSAREILAPAAAGAKIRFERSVDIRYLNQRHEVPVPFKNGELQRRDLSSLREAFHLTYSARYGRAIRDFACEAVTWRVHATVERSKIRIRWEGRGDRGTVGKGVRKVYYEEEDGAVESEVYDRYSLRPGDVVKGPCVVEESESTTVVPPGVGGRVDTILNLILTKRR
jgi:N-methylhydantoinase A/oxoprolinase/acetone carboxylase beta subunit